FDVVEREGLIDHVDPVQYTVRLLIPPGSLLLSRPAVQPFLGQLDEAAFSYRWSHPDPRMDALYRDVTQLVETAAKTDEDPALTFERLRALASALRDGREPVAVGSQILAQRSRPPRLTEPWFC
ncbi:MAG: radical SAM protein, partial [Candidatus Tectomicrobia bacterium]|nr:radical SAM protein [Candidatus Tectomicrobia bacterium]